MDIGAATLNIRNIEYVIKINEKTTYDSYAGVNKTTPYDGWEVRFVSGSILYYPNKPEIAENIQRLCRRINSKG